MFDRKVILNALTRLTSCDWIYTGKPLMLYECVHGIEVSNLVAEECLFGDKSMEKMFVMSHNYIAGLA